MTVMTEPPRDPFGDLLAANARYADRFSGGEQFDGIAHAGLGILTCMDSRIEPLGMVGLAIGDAKIIRSPGGRLTDDAMLGMILGVTLLGVTRIMVIPHTRCAMAQDDGTIRQAAMDNSGVDLGALRIGAFPDQMAAARHDVTRLRQEPLINSRAAVAGFLYDVDTGKLTRVSD